MIRSMTGFAEEGGSIGSARLSWEIRAVNHRYLEINLRLPEELRALERDVRGRVAEYLQRGKLECCLRFETGGEEAPAFIVNTALVRQLDNAAREISALLEHPSPLNIADLLRWPGVLTAAPPDMKSVSTEALALLDKALLALRAHREREGEQISLLLEQRCAEILREASEVRAMLPAILDAQRQRIQQRMEEWRIKLDKERLEQEIAVLTQKSDVAEELDRLEAHVLEVRRVLEGSKPAGRRLDFLMQELNREANTLASKSLHTDTTRIAVNLKVLIEQMREQVQNVE